MPSFILRNIPDELWAQVKDRATRDLYPLRRLILALLEEYVEHGLRRHTSQPKEKQS